MMIRDRFGAALEVGRAIAISSIVLSSLAFGTACSKEGAAPEPQAPAAATSAVGEAASAAPAPPPAPAAADTATPTPSPAADNSNAAAPPPSAGGDSSGAGPAATNAAGPGDKAVKDKATAAHSKGGGTKTSAKADATGGAAGSGGNSTSAPGGAAAACGEKGQPACPLQGWMKSTMGPAVSSGDGPAIGKALDYVAAHAPPGMSNWASIARDGATKAKAGDIAGAKASCKSCHDQYKAKYKTEMRGRPF